MFSEWVCTHSDSNYIIIYSYVVADNRWPKIMVLLERSQGCVGDLNAVTADFFVTNHILRLK